MFVLLLAGASAFAQDTTKEKSTARQGDVIYERQSIELPAGQGIRMPAPPGDDTLVFISSEMNFDGKVVKGAPYSGEAVTETTRTLGDGNHIKHKTTASVYRDGEGRTRREQELGAVGPWVIPGEPQQTVFINDPVTGVNYILDPRTHTARKMAPFNIRIGPLPGDSWGARQRGQSKRQGRPGCVYGSGSAAAAWRGRAGTRVSPLPQFTEAYDGVFRQANNRGRRSGRDSNHDDDSGRGDRQRAAYSDSLGEMVFAGVAGGRDDQT
jgi:hypothetical protein